MFSRIEELYERELIKREYLVYNFIMDTAYLFKHYQGLKALINEHNYRYHVLDAPVISDYEYDQLLAELKNIEEQYPDWIAPDSPSQRVGGGISDRFKKVAHPAPILSLGNAFSDEDLRNWISRISKVDERVLDTSFIVEPKFDGLTVVLQYKKGIFTIGATRGNGEYGEDITINLRTITSLPLHIPISPGKIDPPPSIVVRGEVIIYIKDFKLLNAQQIETGEKVYQTPRNTAAGALRNLDSSVTASRPLRLMAYSIIDSDRELPSTQSGRLELLKNFGFPISSDISICRNIEEVISACKEWEIKRETLPYEIDGVVIKINDIDLAESLGFVGKDPRGAIAYKFPAKEVQTKLIDIRVNVGRTGVLTPYAVLDPVEIGGVVIRQATLHNFDFIKDKDIRINDTVIIKRAGEVIPYVIGPITQLREGEEKTYLPPQKCPACGEPVSHINGEVAWYCVNPGCSDQIMRNIEHYVSRSTMDIVGLGTKIVGQLVGEGVIRDVADLYSLRKDDLLQLDGFAEKKAENILSAIVDSKNKPLAKFIFALGIRGVGEVVGMSLADRYFNVDNLSRASTEDLETIEGIGPNISQAIVDWFSHPANQKLLTKLKTVNMWPIQVQDSEYKASMTLGGKTLVITGSFEGFTREEINDYIRAHGGKLSSSISTKTDYIVVGENPGSKLGKARELGIHELSESTLRQLAEQ